MITKAQPEKYDDVIFVVFDTLLFQYDLFIFE